MNVEISITTETSSRSTSMKTTKLFSNPNCKITMLNGQITAIHVERENSTGGIEFETKFVEFETFLQNCLDVFHSVQLEQIDERRNREGTDSPASEKSL